MDYSYEDRAEDAEEVSDDHGLVLCRSADGWSLHAPGSTDEDIAAGHAPYLASGAGEPTQADYDAAAAQQQQGGAMKAKGGADVSP